jgi:hypothetical protein
MSVWNWIQNYEAQALQNGDEARQAMCNSFFQALDLHSTDPDQGLTLFSQSRSLAVRLNEPWWVLVNDHWRLQTLISFKGDYTIALDLAVRAAVEVRKPIYAQLPQRLCLHEDLINVYMGIDPLGHAATIEKALVYMQSEISPDLECHKCLYCLKTDYAITLDRLQEAETEINKLLAECKSQGDNHYTASAYKYLCKLAQLHQDWEGLLAMASEGEIYSRRLHGQPMKLWGLIAWQALAKRHLGAKKEAQRLYLQATTQVARINTVPGFYYFDALVGYREAGNEIETALKIRQRQLSILKGKGQYDNECTCRLDCLRLMALLGKNSQDEDFRAELQAVRELAQKLINPQSILTKLEQYL